MHGGAVSTDIGGTAGKRKFPRRSHCSVSGVRTSRSLWSGASGCKIDGSSKLDPSWAGYRLAAREADGVPASMMASCQ